MRVERVALGVLPLLAVVAWAGPGDELPPPPPPSYAFYVERVAPWVEEHCAPCHRTGGGDLRLAPTPDRRRDFDGIAPFLDAARPEDSPFVLKALELADGGLDHAGGAFFSTDDERYETVLDLAAGATPTNLVPEAWLEDEVLRAAPGEAVRLDGSHSYDRDRGDELQYRWFVHAAPAGARPTLSSARGARTQFTPDVAGTYVLRLRVSDGKVWSAAREVVIEAYAGSAAQEIDVAAPSGLEKLEPEHVRRIRRLYLDVLGRSPTPGEVHQADTLAWRDLVVRLLGRPEAGRAFFEAAALRLGLVGDHRPRGDEAAGLPARFAAAGLAPHAAEAVLVRDPAFREAWGTGRSLADGVVRALLERAPNPDEIEAATADPDAWVGSVLASDAFLEAAVRRRLTRFLGPGDARRVLPGAVGAARDGGGAWRAYLVARAAGAEYVQRTFLRAKDDLTFVRGVWVDLFGRAPTRREWSALWRAVQVLPGRTAPRAAVVKLLLDSGQVPLPLLVDITDARAWLADRFLRYLGRLPGEAEIEAYGRALLDPAGGPEVVVRALLTGPEYACR